MFYLLAHTLPIAPLSLPKPSFARHYHPSLTKSATTKQHTVIKIPPSFIKLNGMVLYKALTDILFTLFWVEKTESICV